MTSVITNRGVVAVQTPNLVVRGLSKHIGHGHIRCHRARFERNLCHGPTRRSETAPRPRSDEPCSRSNVPRPRANADGLGQDGCLLITFGFTLFKFFQYLKEHEPGSVEQPVLGARTFGMVMIVIGVLTLALRNAAAPSEYERAARAQYPRRRSRSPCCSPP